jgi:hypothetical protein
MNTTNIIKLVAALGWAGVAVSSATPASAIAVTYQSGPYAACSNNADAFQASFYGCDASATFSTSYLQRIQFVTQTCNGGGCQPGASSVYTDFIYTTGRKPASLLDWTCDGDMILIYTLGSCAC